MLLWLEDRGGSVAAIATSSTKLKALKNIIAAGRLGLHAVFGDRDFLNAVSELEGLDAGEAAFLRKKALELVQVVHALREYRRVRVSSIDHHAQRTGEEWLVPIEYFVDDKVLDPPVLVGEHIRDANFYKLLASTFAASTASGQVIRLTPVLGGGSTTCDVLRQYCMDGAPSWICVVDSDKRFSDGPVGETAARCLRVTVPSGHEWRYSLHVLPTRTVENLVPSTLRLEMLDGMSTEHFASHELMNALPRNVSAFVAIKTGDDLCRFYMRGDLLAATSSEAGLHCVVCGKSGGCGKLASFSKLFPRLVEALMSGQVKIPPLNDWPEDLRSVAALVASFGLGDMALRV